jgi:cytochrome c oxidase subunit 2
MATARRDGDRERAGVRRGFSGWLDRSGWSVGRRRMLRRGAGLGAVAVAALALTACGDEKPYSHITPRTNEADKIQSLYILIFWMAVVVFIGVQFLILYTALRFRQRRRLADRPEQVHGNTRLEIAWTIVPAIVLLIIFVPTVAVLYDAEAEADDEAGALIVEVYGKQWWWEVHYPDAYGEDAEPLITANEIRLPAGQKVIFKLYTNNVIHSFWVPQLHGKMDLMPGNENRLAFTPEIPGVYYGECAELCGTQHAWMRFTVIVEPKPDFDAWVAAWAQPPQFDGNPGTADVVEGPPSFGQCLQCHRINGTNAAVAPVGYEAPYYTGPNLTLFGCRSFFAGGIMETNEANVRAWLDDPHNVKPGNLMGYQITADTLSPEQIDELTKYLLGLRMPDGSCPPDPGEPAAAATPVAAVTSSE